MSFLRYFPLFLAWFLLIELPPGVAADPAPEISARELAARLDPARGPQKTLIRARMEVAGSDKQIFQLQIKERRGNGVSEVVYQVLWPKEREGEAVLLRQTGDRNPTGYFAKSAGSVTPIGDFKDSLLESDLAYADVIENFFAWDQQNILGQENVNGVVCIVLESKPGKGERSIYSSVRSWIDPRRFVVLRVEKFTGGSKPIRRFETTRVASDAGRHIPMNLSVQGLRGSTTDINGSKIRHDISFSDEEFSEKSFHSTPPPGARE